MFLQMQTQLAFSAINAAARKFTVKCFQLGTEIFTVPALDKINGDASKKSECSLKVLRADRTCAITGHMPHGQGGTGLICELRARELVIVCRDQRM